MSERDPWDVGIDMEHWVNWHALHARPRYHQLTARIGWTRNA